uniref:Putative cathepsin b-like cysteine protease form 2 n=1 Tax=Rhipicephalus pulchellus TaxID=72859 RepID=L7M824_RHIPC
MNFLLALSLFVVTPQDRVMVPPSVHPLSDEMIDFINKLNTTWKAGRNFDKNVPFSYIKGLMGVARNKTRRLPTLMHSSIPDNLPESFDARQHWRKCNSIHVIRDQSSCGACWAFGAVEAISDRICIHTKGSVQVNISAQDLLTCCDYCRTGCKGGVPSYAWMFYKEKGIVTGGLYGTEDGCQPYSIHTTRYTTTGLLPPPINDLSPMPPCKRECRKSYGKKYSEDKHYGEKVYTLSGDEAQIKTEIFKNGPVEADFAVYADFYSYKSGVYQAHSRVRCGSHAIRILGWGTENGVPYWLAANSWTEHWGDKGYFKIRRGNNECGIEEDINAGIPKEPKA